MSVTPRKPGSISLKPSTSLGTPAAGKIGIAGVPRPSFGNVRGGSTSTSTAPASARRADFGNVSAGVVSSAPRALPSTYTVLRGDSLSKIAKRLYGKTSAWPQLFEANRDQIDDADLIHPGQVLRVPQL